MGLIMKHQAYALNRLAKRAFPDLPEIIGIFVSEKGLKSNVWARCLPQILKVRVLNSLEKLPEPLKAGGMLKVPAYEKEVSDVSVFVLPEDLSVFSLLGFARSSLATLLSSHHKGLGLVLVEGREDLAECLGAALAVRTFSMPLYGKKAKEHKAFKLKVAEIYSSKNLMKAFEYGFETGNGTNLARYLGALPPNELPPSIYGKKIQELAKKNRLSCKFYSKSQLKKMGAGAFTAVDQGNPDSKGGIYELTYNPKRAKNKKIITLVGKGLCYDTGGYDIKTSGYMVGMKVDMLGSAVALSTIITVAKLKLPMKMKCFLGVTSNHISPMAYKADDVVTAMNGTSIEVINTDAEGRMVLADTLCLASQAKPEMIVDFATLTGTATVAIGTNYSAGFTNQEALHPRIVKAGKKSGERVWTFPMDKDYGKALKSEIADTLQCIKARGPDHILAAYFLAKFVGKGIDWVHIDLASGDREGGLAHVDSTVTGFGVRWCLAFLKEQYKL